MKNKPPSNQPLKRSLDAYARYSTLVLQMAVLIGGGAGVGLWLDRKVAETALPLFTIGGAVTGFALSLYFLLRELSKRKNIEK